MSLASSLLTLARVAIKRRPGLSAGKTIPELARERVVVVDEGWARAYRGIVGAVDDGFLPSCAVQVLASPLHTALLADDRFPLPVVGMVHVDNVITEHARIPVGATLQLAVRTGGHEPHDKGVTFSIATTAKLDGVVVWSGTMTALVRTKSASPTKKTDKQKPAPSTSTLVSSSSIRVREDQGRRYARVSGDANPIHLTAVTAKPLGFPRAIAHGMWTLARALSEVDGALPSTPRTITAKFIKPVSLPSAVIVEARAADGVVDVVVAPERGGAPHVVIGVRSAS